MENNLPYMQPDLFGPAIHSNNTFDIFVGLGSDKEVLPHYLCLNKQTGVVEFEAENFFMARSWIDHFETQMKDLDKPKKQEDPITIQDVLPFRKPDKLN